MPKLAVIKSSKEKKKKNPLQELKEKILKYKNRNTIINANPFESPEEENTVSCIWRRILYKPTKNSVKYGCPHNLYEIFKEFYTIDDKILCTNNKNCICYNGGEHSIRNDMIVRELTFKDINVNWKNKQSSKSQLEIQYNHEQPILIQLHRRGGSTFEKDFRPGNYNKIHNRFKNAKKSKKKYERFSFVFRNKPITFCVNDKVTLEFQLETSCNDLVDKVSDVVGGIGLCAAPPDNHIYNCILFRTNLIDNDTYLCSKIRIINKSPPNYGDTIKIGTLEVPLCSLPVYNTWNQFDFSIANHSGNSNNISDDSNNISDNINNNIANDNYNVVNDNYNIVNDNYNIVNDNNNNIANDNDNNISSNANNNITNGNNNNTINSTTNDDNDNNMNQFSSTQITIQNQWTTRLQENSTGQVNPLFHQGLSSFITNYNNIIHENAMLKEFVKFIERSYPNQITEYVTLHPEHLSLSLYSILSPPPIFNEHLDSTSPHDPLHRAEDFSSLFSQPYPS